MPPRSPSELDTVHALRLLWRAVRLRCPHCGRGRVLDGPLALRERCSACGLLLARGEGDHFLGAYLFNLVAVELLLAAALAAVVVATWPDPPWQWLEWGGVALALVGAVVCYPFTKVLWLAVDLWLRPVTARELAAARGERPERVGELV